MNTLSVGIAISSARLWEEAQRELQTLPVTIVLEQGGLTDPATLLQKIEKSRPDVLLLDPTCLAVSLAEVIPGIKAASSHPFVIILREVAAPEDILTAIRAGANEYLYCPLANVLREALERLSFKREDRSASTPQNAISFGFLGAKGGCGTTTVACHLAVELARTTKKQVLLGDFDFAAGLIRILMQAKSRYSILDAMTNTQRLDESYWRALVSNGYSGVEVIAGPVSEVLREYPKPADIRQVLHFAKRQYDFLTLDLGHGLAAGSMSALEELDELCLITTPEMPALQMTKIMLGQLSAIGFRRNHTKLVLNRMSRRSQLTTEEIENAIGMEVSVTVPNDYRALEEAYSAGELLPEKSSIRESVRRLVRKLANVSAEEKKKRFSLFG
ncbi:MAG: AAA family ATPase [Paludibaculum sp.]